MPSNSRINGPALASMVVGSLLLYSGVTGRGILASIQAIITGKAPSTAPVTNTINAAVSTGSGTTSDFVPTTGSGPAANKELAKRLAVSMGHADWTTGQMWSDWDALWTQESGWSEHAKNPSSGAFGIPQALPASKMASAGADWQTNPATQIKWGIDYIAGRYGNPSIAEAHERANNWY